MVQGKPARPLGTRTRRLRCFDCFRQPHLCEACALLVHSLNPFHRLLKWDPETRTWQKITCSDIGLRLYYAHDGQPCPAHFRADETRSILVVHEHGMMKMRFGLCAYPKHGANASEQASDEPYQLLEMGLFPGSWDVPRTVYTTNVLRQYHLLTLQAHTTVHDFHAYLRRTTDNIAPHAQPDRHREFSQAMREFSFLRACRRFGVRPQVDMPFGSLAVLCPACPQPGKNMRPGWQVRDIVFRFLDALHYSMDGNYRSSQRKKPWDKFDVSLMGAAAYFVHQGDFKYYLSHIGETEEEESTCNKFGAFLGTYLGDLTGIIAMTCRHELIMANSIVDLLRNEKPSFADFSLVSALQRYLELLLLLQSYDVNCQYLIRLLIRLLKIEAMLPHLKTIKSVKLPELRGSVGSFHVRMHKLDCQTKQNPEFLPGFGRTWGDQTEHTWAKHNLDAPMTKEMTTGHRQDRMNDGFADTNITKVHDMPRTLAKKYREAKKQLRTSSRFLTKFEKSIDSVTLATWKKEEAEWLAKVVNIKNHKDLDNPFVPDVDESLSQEAIREKLTSERATSGDTSGMSVVAAIEGMIELESERASLLDEILTFDRSKHRKRNKMKKEVDDFLIKAQLCHDAYNRYVTPQVALACADVAASPLPTTFPWRDPEDDRANGIKTQTPRHSRKIHEPLDEHEELVNELVELVENVAILLPSQYHSKVRKHSAMLQCVAIERRLREGQANDALDEFRTVVSARISLQDLRSQGWGQKHGKRLRAMDAKEKAVGEAARSEYHRIRSILLVLGMSDKDATYRVIKDADASPFIVTMEQRRPGDSHRTPSWVWADFSFVDNQPEGPTKEFINQKRRAHWFRCRAAKARWEEEFHLKHEEMYRTATMFKTERDEWLSRASAEEARGKEGCATYYRKQAHRYTRLLEQCDSLFPTSIYTQVWKHLVL
ncbi:hypothetical protein K466DRAFT_491107 [Polyporus arcularius HHB13444]|uniref:CxC2-like cysteine cluster KDZ transposase-associated domain-containing protein n=1 Tax=Polyporus arcularius HHB13444 TaxID=1314778 RepID=A0A5C3PDC7_9APHY|nr:hypothetical protein K466DRAFT_491107 [Polyporus arcularius HHB13444]